MYGSDDRKLKVHGRRYIRLPPYSNNPSRHFNLFWGEDPLIAQLVVMWSGLRWQDIEKGYSCNDVSHMSVALVLAGCSSSDGISSIYLTSLEYSIGFVQVVHRTLTELEGVHSCRARDYRAPTLERRLSMFVVTLRSQ